MKKPKPYKNKKRKTVQAEEPQPDYGSKDAFKTIRFFASFEEMNEYESKERAALSYNERMQYAEDLRKRTFNKYLLPNGKWKSIAKVFKVMPPYTNEISQ